MKKRPHIVLLAVAIVCMMMMVIVPHHHNAMGACLVQEICHQDGRVNDSHTRHAAESNTHHIVPVTGKHISLTSLSEVGGGHSFWVPFFLLGLPGMNDNDLCLPLFLTRRACAFASLAWHGQQTLSDRLRAPPYTVL